MLLIECHCIPTHKIVHRVMPKNSMKTCCHYYEVNAKEKKDELLLYKNGRFWVSLLHCVMSVYITGLHSIFVLLWSFYMTHVTWQFLIPALLPTSLHILHSLDSTLRPSLLTPPSTPHSMHVDTEQAQSQQIVQMCGPMPAMKTPSCLTPSCRSTSHTGASTSCD